LRNGGICIIGERLYELRKDADLTQDELATILNINKHSISSYERDKSEPPDVIKIAIAQYFDVSIDYLLGLTDNPSPTVRTEKSYAFRTPFLKICCPNLICSSTILFIKKSKPNKKTGSIVLDRFFI